MERKNKKILMMLVIILSILAFILMAIFAINKKREKDSLKTTPSIENQTNKEQEELSFQINEEKKVQVEAIRNIKGKIIVIDISAIEVISAEGEKLTLNVPQEGVNFLSQIKGKDGAFSVKEIGLLDIPKDKEVDIQYNSSNNEVMLVNVQ